MGIDRGDALMTYKDELLLVSSGTLYTYSPENDVWIEKGTLSSCQLDLDNVIRNNAEQTVCDVGISSNDVQMVAYEDTRGGVRCTVLDRTSGARYMNDQLVDVSGSMPRVIATRNYLYCYYRRANDVRWKRVTSSEPRTLSSVKILRSDVHATSGVFDITRYGAENAAMCYYDNGNRLVTLFIDNQGEEGNIASGFANRVSASIDPPRCIDITTQGNDHSNLAIAWTNDSGSVVTFYDGLLSGVNGPFVIDTTPTGSHIVGVQTNDLSGRVQYFTEVSMSNASNNYIRTNTVTHDLVTSSLGATTFMRSLCLASKPFVRDGKAHVNCVHDSTLQSTAFTCASDANFTGSIVAKASRGRVGNAGGKYDTPRLPAFEDVGSETFVTAGTVRGITQAEAGSTDNLFFSNRGLQTLSYDFTPTDVYSYDEGGDTLIVGGGVVKSYDGASITETGFHLWPETVSWASGSGNITAGSYQYSITYDWIDAQGRRWQSAASIPVTAAVTGTCGINVTFPMLRLTEKLSAGNEPHINVWRTVDGGSTNFYKVTTTTTEVTNDPSVDTGTFLDTLPDSQITGSNVLYTNGGAYDNISPPAMTIVKRHNDRIWLTGDSTGNSLWFSKRIRDDHGVQFSDMQVMNIEPAGGRITALASLDNMLLVFKRDNVYGITGEGPNDQGISEVRFTRPTLVHIDVGCTNERSIVRIPAGVVFKSSKGLYLIDRSLGSSYIGAPVEAFNDLTITSAVLMDDDDQVRWTTAEGTILVYDYLHNAWTTFTDLPAEDATLWNAQHCLVRSNGKVMKEDPNSYKDDGFEYRMLIETGWIKPQEGYQTHMHVRNISVLGSFESRHKVKVRVYYDYSNSFDTYYIDPSEFMSFVKFGTVWKFAETGGPKFAGGSSGAYQWQIGPRRRRCQAIKLRFEDMIDDETTDATGEAFKLTHLELGIVPLGGDARLAATRRF